MIKVPVRSTAVLSGLSQSPRAKNLRDVRIVGELEGELSGRAR